MLRSERYRRFRNQGLQLLHISAFSAVTLVNANNKMVGDHLRLLGSQAVLICAISQGLTKIS